jgi:hypothetical protein
MNQKVERKLKKREDVHDQLGQQSPAGNDPTLTGGCHESGNYG